ncbi:MAG: hypothetical protein ABJP87_21910 [Bauldia litoralis]|uniref:hypothetical protein n=1 Tax=Bauldia litoralis TaxID=665467 RepID=UPI00329981C7
MRMIFMGPCLSRVWIAADAVVGGGPALADLWQDVATRARARPSIFDLTATSFAHSSEAVAERPVRYETVTDDTPMLPAHLLDTRVVLDGALRAEILATAVRRLTQSPHDETAEVTQGQIDVVPEEAYVRLYYGGVMIVWFSLGPAQGFGQSGDGVSAEELEAVEQLGMALLQALAARIDDELVGIFSAETPAAGRPGGVRGLAGRLFGSGTGERLPWTVSEGAPERRAEPGVDRGPALWVTRSLVLDSEDAGGVAALADWLDPVSQDDWRKEMSDEGLSMRWLRYAFDESAMAERGIRFVDAWESMLFSQFFWAALEQVEHRMFGLLGEINASSKPAEVRASYARLDRTREEAELTLAHHRHLKRYLTRTRNRQVNRILEGWGFSRLVGNLHDVIGVARSRHEQLLQRAAARSSVFTDLLLFAIGSVAVLDFFVGMSVVGRQLGSDPAIGRRDEGWFDILGYVSSLRMDTVFSVAASFVIVVALLLFWYRKRQLY